MPRHGRLDIPDTVYHVFSRGHNKSPLFLDDEDRFLFLKYVRRAQERHPWLCLGYTLMTNHYHFQIKTLNIPLGKTMHLLNTLYAGYFNFRYKNVGHVFQNRFHSIPVQVDRYLLTLSRYIHLNPVNAGMVTKPEDYDWSSYREYLGFRQTGLIHPDSILSMFPGDLTAQRQSYRHFIEEGIGHKAEFTETTIWKTRIFGDEAFTKWVVSHCPDILLRKEHKQEQLAI